MECAWLVIVRGRIKSYNADLWNRPLIALTDVSLIPQIGENQRLAGQRGSTVNFAGQIKHRGDHHVRRYA